MLTEIPHGYCQCGCGRKTPIARSSDASKGYVKGEPYRFCMGHKTRNPLTIPVNTSGLCGCGCGQRTPLASVTNTSRGWIKGQPTHFLRGHARRNDNLAAGFWKYVAPSASDICWDWQGYINDQGYGEFRSDYHLHRAHRVSYELHNGPIPNGYHVCHHCDNRACVNPTHLFLGKDIDNVRDMDSKGRRVNSPQLGESHGMARLTTKQVSEIRQLAASGVSNDEIANRFQISDTHAWRIVTRRAWAHVP